MVTTIWCMFDFPFGVSLFVMAQGKTLVFFRVWFSDLHVPYMLSVDDLGDFSWIMWEPPHLETGDFLGTYCRKTLTPQSNELFPNNGLRDYKSKCCGNWFVIRRGPFVFSSKTGPWIAMATNIWRAEFIIFGNFWNPCKTFAVQKHRQKWFNRVISKIL